MRGIVKWFSQEKGFGFITPDSGEDHYFNIQSIKGADLPSNGDKVTFDSRVEKKGAKAFNVCIVEKSLKQTKMASDDRISCQKCGKKITPRLIIKDGEPQKSVCPYCASTVKTFGPNIIGYAVLALIIIYLIS